MHKVVNSYIYWLCCMNANYSEIFLHFETDTSFENITTAPFQPSWDTIIIYLIFFATVSCWIAWCLPTCYGPRVKLPLKKRVLLKNHKKHGSLWKMPSNYSSKTRDEVASSLRRYDLPLRFVHKYNGQHILKSRIINIQ